MEFREGKVINPVGNIGQSSLMTLTELNTVITWRLVKTAASTPSEQFNLAKNCSWITVMIIGLIKGTGISLEKKMKSQWVKTISSKARQWPLTVKTPHHLPSL